MEKQTATLYGIGVGPGDPELITVKAVNILKKVDVIFAPTHQKTKYSLALEIIHQYIESHTTIRHLFFAMEKDKLACQKLCERNSKFIAQELMPNQSGAFITLGDPMLYSTYIYILKDLQARSPEIKVKTIPGISSINAASALVNIPLAEGDERLTIMSGTNGISHIKEIVSEKDNIIIMKTYKEFQKIYQELRSNNLLKHSSYVSRCGLNEECCIKDMDSIEDPENFQPTYLSMIIVKKNGEKDRAV